MKAHKKRNDNLWKKYLCGYFIFFTVVLLLGYSAQHPIKKNIAHAQTSTTTSVQKKGVVRRPVTPTPSMTANGVEGETYKFDVVGQIKKIWGKDANIGIAIASCESGLRTNAYNINSNGTLDFSVFQINTVHGAILDPIENITYAYKLFTDQGTNPWNSSKHCWEAKL